MKKKVLSTILSIAMVAAMLMGCTTESPASSDSGDEVRRQEDWHHDPEL